MEYAPLTWMSSARCHLNLLDKVQRRTERRAVFTHTLNTQLYHIYYTHT